MGAIALTGATGFVGSHLVDRLAAEGHELKCLVRPRRGRSQHERAQVEWVGGTVTDANDLARLVEGAGTVIHVAGLTRALDVDGFHVTNSRATALLVAKARQAGVQTFILVSSLAASRPHVSPYAWSKALAEEAATALAGDMRLVIVRPPAILGPGDGATRDVMALLRRGWLACPGGADGSTFSWIDVEDLSRLVAGLAGSPPAEARTCLAVCSGQDISWRDVAAAAETALGRTVRCVAIPGFAVKAIGGLAGAAARLTRTPLILSPGKANELLQADWHADSIVSAPTPLHQTLSRCFLGEPERNEAN